MNVEASQLRDQDLVKWIENKLGDPNELWAARQASSLLTKTMVIELETCFQGLEPYVKLKIIQAILHLSPKLVQMWREPLSNLISLARRDPDEWVEIVSDMYRDFPEKGCIRCTPSNPKSYFYRTLTDLEKIIKEKAGNADAPCLLPPDCEVLSRSAIKLRYGYAEVKQVKHFNVNNNSKSQRLLEELEKAAEQLGNQLNKKNNGIISSFPIKMRSTLRKPNNNLPMRGIPSVNTYKISGGFTNEPKKFQRQLTKREGGAMLIDIAELPHLSSKRRKIADIVHVSPKKNVNINSFLLSSLCPKASTSKQSEIKPFEIKLLSPEKKKKIQEMVNKNINDEELSKKKKSLVKSKSDSDSANQSPSVSKLKNEIIDDNTTAKTKYKNCGSLFSPVASYKVPSFSSSKSDYGLDSQQNQIKPSTSGETPFYGSKSNDDDSAEYSKSMASIQESIKNSELSSPIKRQLDELLKDANKLNPVSQNLITAFLCGNRSNPLQSKVGDVVTFPLSETVENEQSLIDGSCTITVIQTFFQMDYRTGEWKRLRKSRVLLPEEKVNYLSQQRNKMVATKFSAGSTSGNVLDGSPSKLAFPSNLNHR